MQPYEVKWSHEAVYDAADISDYIESLLYLFNFHICKVRNFNKLLLHLHNDEA